MAPRTVDRKTGEIIGTLETVDLAGSPFERAVRDEVESEAIRYRDRYGVAAEVAIRLATKHVKEVADAIALDASQELERRWVQLPLT